MSQSSAVCEYIGLVDSTSHPVFLFFPPEPSHIIYTFLLYYSC